jgi:hypothetical protein
MGKNIFSNSCFFLNKLTLGKRQQILIQWGQLIFFNKISPLIAQLNKLSLNFLFWLHASRKGCLSSGPMTISALIMLLGGVEINSLK